MPRQLSRFHFYSSTFYMPFHICLKNNVIANETGNLYAAAFAIDPRKVYVATLLFFGFNWQTKVLLVLLWKFNNRLVYNYTHCMYRAD